MKCLLLKEMDVINADGTIDASQTTHLRKCTVPSNLRRVIYSLLLRLLAINVIQDSSC